MAGTRPFTPWKKGDNFSASHLNEMVGIARSRNITLPRGNLRHLPNGTSIDIPEPFTLGPPRPGMVYSAGPGGEADFINENYWVWLSYAVAGKWGATVDIDSDYVGTGTDLSNVIVPATNWSERQPGGPAGVGTHVLRVGTPVYLYPVYGRSSVSTDTTMVQRFVFLCEDVGVGQYPGEVLVTEAPHTRQWSYEVAMPDLT
jgi:hypothetical protein